MSRATTPLSVEEIVDRFHQTFRDSENIVLVGGFPEPLYVPSENGGPDEIRYTCDWVRSVLHEVAHWCLVGRKRRRLVDYGFWYHPNGRTQDQQNLFFRVEARPQALEWIFALVAGVPFQISLDNVTGAELDTSAFQAAVREQFGELARQGLPPRAARFVRALADDGDVDLLELWEAHKDDPIW